jgi:hypothetical protein
VTLDASMLILMTQCVLMYLIATQTFEFEMSCKSTTRLCMDRNPPRKKTVKGFKGFCTLFVRRLLKSKEDIMLGRKSLLDANDDSPRVCVSYYQEYGLLLLDMLSVQLWLTSSFLKMVPDSHFLMTLDISCYLN